MNPHELIPCRGISSGGISSGDSLQGGYTTDNLSISPMTTRRRRQLMLLLLTMDKSVCIAGRLALTLFIMVERSSSSGRPHTRVHVMDVIMTSSFVLDVSIPCVVTRTLYITAQHA